MNNIYKILIVEDDDDMAESIKYLLKKWNLHCDICTDFSNILKYFEEVNPHIVLMDVTLPAFDGFYWCKKIRSISKVPIIFVSSMNIDMNLVMAISHGADDYIQKPFNSNILIAKIQAIIRRTYEYRLIENQILEYKGLVLNLNDSSIHYNNSTSILTKNESTILETLMKSSGKIVSRNSLMKILWNDDVYVNENTLTVNINRLRKKLKDIGINNFIDTKKGMGYIIS